MSGDVVTLRLVFYNLEEGRQDAEVQEELRALAQSFGPQVLCGCEAVGYQLPDLSGYVKIHDRSTPSTANVFAYVPQGVPLELQWWHTYALWPDTNPAHPGTHPPRSFLDLYVEQVQVVVGQQAPITRYRATNDQTIAAQQEAAAMLTHCLNQGAAGQPTLALCDWNDVSRFLKEPGVVPEAGRPTAQTVARDIEGTVVGDPHKVDKAVVRNVQGPSFSYPTKAGAVTLGSDHKDALLLEVEVEPQWWTTP